MDSNYFIIHEYVYRLSNLIQDLFVLEYQSYYPMSAFLIDHNDFFTKKTGIRFHRYTIGTYHFKIIDEKKFLMTKIKYGI